MPIEVRISNDFHTKCDTKDWFNALYREGYVVVSSGRDLAAHHARTEIKRIPGLTNWQKIQQNLAQSDQTFLHPAWVVNRKLLEDRISTSIQNIGEIIVENILVKSTDAGPIYILQVCIDLTLSASYKLNKMDPMPASFILDKSLNLQRILPLVIICKNELYLGINDPEMNENDDTSEDNLKKIMFNLSNSNQLSPLQSLHKNRRLLEEAISAKLHDNCINANIYDISLISIEKTWIEESDEEEQQIIDVKIETNRTRTPIAASFVLTPNFNLAKHFVKMANLYTDGPTLSQKLKLSSEEIDNKKCEPLAEFINSTFKSYASPQPVKAGKTEKAFASFITDEGELELPDYDKVLEGQVTPVEKLAEKHGIQWSGQNRLPFFASLSLQPPATLEYSPKSKTPESNQARRYLVNNFSHPWLK